jgi:NADH-quinone oxidoreductase subunit N
MNSFLALLPLLVIVFVALAVLILEVFLNRENKDYLAYISLSFIVICAFVCIQFWNRSYSYFDGNLLLDKYSLFFMFILLLSTGFVILLSMKYIALQDVNYGEYYALLLLALSGVMIMVSSPDLLVIILGLEVLSISSYALTGLMRKDEKSSEAAIKYFLLGSFATAFLLYGLALLYGTSHTTYIPTIIQYFSREADLSLMALIGLGLIFIGFGFKIAVVPFHMWTPDVYQGAPTPITAFFSVVPKAAGFAILLRIFFPYWKTAINSQSIFVLLWVISVLTMVIGNLIALRQTNVKRILAYSSIAHAGYLLVAILAQDNSSLVFYLTVYLFMNMGATFSIFLLSLAGFPPTGGFLAKFYVFSSAVKQGLVPLVIIGVLASLISVFYYLRIVVYMYMREPSREVDIAVENPALFLVLFFCLYGVLQLGLYPRSILILIQQAISPFL